MEWIHVVLSVIIYAKVGFLIYYILKYLNIMQETKGRANIKRNHIKQG